MILSSYSSCFSLPAQKLNLDDLLNPLASSTSLKKSLQPLTTSKARTLTAPLQHRAQERLDREAAYEQTKEEVDKWKATMKRIQEAEHLSFPLQQSSSRLGKVSNLELAAKFKVSLFLLVLLLVLISHLALDRNGECSGRSP